MKGKKKKEKKGGSEGKIREKKGEKKRKKVRKKEKLKVIVTLTNITLCSCDDCARTALCPMEATVTTRCFELFPLRVSDGGSHCDQGRSFHISRYG